MLIAGRGKVKLARMSVKAFYKKQIESVRDLYVKDLDAMSQEDLGKVPGGAARTPFDFTYETMFVNGRITKRLKGETPDPMSGDDGWMKAPAEFCQKERAVAEFKDSMDAILAAWDTIDESKAFDTIVLPTSETSLAGLAHFACVHNAYHDAQLNYHQAIHGDDKMHWD